MKKLELSFVGGRTVDGRHGDAIEAQINAHLRAVMHVVVENETSHHNNFRHAEHRLIAIFHRPVRHPF